MEYRLSVCEVLDPRLSPGVEEESTGHVTPPEVCVRSAGSACNCSSNRPFPELQAGGDEVGALLSLLPSPVRSRLILNQPVKWCLARPG